MTPGWTHAQCEQCWNDRNPDREPVKLRDPDWEVCCFCGTVTQTGIYVRADPNDDALFCHSHPDGD